MRIKKKFLQRINLTSIYPRDRIDGSRPKRDEKNLRKRSFDDAQEINRENIKGQKKIFYKKSISHRSNLMIVSMWYTRQTTKKNENQRNFPLDDGSNLHLF